MGYNDMKIPTVKIRRKSDGATKIVNEIDYARDLGQVLFRGWERVGEEHGDKSDAMATVQLAAGKVKVSEQEAMVPPAGENETEKFREVKRRRGRPRKNEVPNANET